MVGPWKRGSEASMPWSIDHMPGCGSLPFSARSGGTPVNRRTLFRVLAAMLAIAAISPLFAVDCGGGDQGSRHQSSVQSLQQRPR